VSLLPNLFLLLIPSRILQQQSAGALNYQNIFLSFASAGLLGDVFLHTLPHLLAPHSHSHSHDHSHNHSYGGHDVTERIHEDGHDMDHSHHDHNHNHNHEEGMEGKCAGVWLDGYCGNDAASEHHHLHSAGASPSDETLYDILRIQRELLIPLALLLGFMVFMIAEKLASSHNHNHSHIKIDNEQREKAATTHPTYTRPSATTKTTKSVKTTKPTAAQTQSTHGMSSDAQVVPGDSTVDEPPVRLTTTSASLSTSSSTMTLWQAMRHSLQTAGWLNLLADSMHNFTDGIAIGASFASGHGLGYATFLSVIFHEIPHEIGDFTILLQSGLSKTQAIQAQFMTAVAAVLGTSIGLLAHRSEVAEELLLAFTAGGFVYLATVTMLPNTMMRGGGTGGTGGTGSCDSPPAMLQIILEVTSFIAGIGMMVLVLLFE